MRAVLAVVLIVIAIRCVPGRLGVVNVGALIPPMPLKTTPTPWLEPTSARPVSTETPSATPTPTLTPTLVSPYLPGTAGSLSKLNPLTSADQTARGEVGEWLKPAVC